MAAGLADAPSTAPGAQAEPEAPAAPPAAGDDKPKIDREDPALAEKFAVIGAGEAECKACAYLYSPARGDPEYPVMKGTLFKDLPDDWTCPTCGAEKQFFSPIEKTVAGFASNQGYGFGTNTMTEGEKSVLIYGALAFFFGLFIAGYLLD